MGKTVAEKKKRNELPFFFLFLDIYDVIKLLCTSFDLQPSKNLLISVVYSVITAL